MNRKLLTGNQAAAWAARLAKVDYIPAFPITPQTEIIETIGDWIEQGSMPARMTTLESEHSMITAAGAAAATGVRVFTATSSQGLLYGMEMIYTVASWRAPFVMVNVSRGLSAPITLEPDHNDVLAARDSGFIQIHCASCQEVLDCILLAYRLTEDHRVRVPAIVNMDGFYLSFTREPVSLPTAEEVDQFIGKYDPENLRFTARTPISQAVAVLGGIPYSYFRYQTHMALQNALPVYNELAQQFEEQFGRNYAPVECYRMENAEYALFMMGSFATKAKAAVDRMRKMGWAVGLLRPRLLRPFPEDEIYLPLRGVKGVAVIDQNLSMGKGGVLHTELASALYGKKDAPPVLASFIGGLGGRDITSEEFMEMITTLRKATESGEQPAPRLLFTEQEYREVKKLQAIAQVERIESVQIP